MEDTRKWGTRESSILFYTEEGQYTEALSLLSSLERPLEPRLLLAKCTCLYNKGMIAQTIESVKEAEKQGWDLPDFFMIKGKALYRINEFESAKSAFDKCDSMFPSPEVKRWIQRCIARIAASGDEVMSRRVIRHEPRLSQLISRKVKHEFYQSQTHLTLSVFVKGVTESQLHVRDTKKSISVAIDTSPPIEFHATLLREIVPGESKVTITQKKVEIKMRKSPNSIGHWNDIEAG